VQGVAPCLRIGCPRGAVVVLGGNGKLFGRNIFCQGCGQLLETFPTKLYSVRTDDGRELPSKQQFYICPRCGAADFDVLITNSSGLVVETKQRSAWWNAFL
jgi:hypothetical protein